MKKFNEHLIWSSDINEEMGKEEDIQEWWEEMCEINNHPKEWVHDEDKKMESIYKCVGDYLDDVWVNLSSCKDGHESAYYLVIADIGRWDGRYDGGKIVQGLRNTIEKCMSGEDYSKIYIKNNNLYVDTANHDGSSFFKIYRLTEKGTDFVDRHAYDMDDRELHQHLMKNRHFRACAGKTFKEVYGW